MGVKRFAILAGALVVVLALAAGAFLILQEDDLAPEQAVVLRFRLR